MEMQTSNSAIIAAEQAAGGASVPGRLLRLNAIVWIAGLTLSLVASIPTALRYEASSGLTVRDGRLALDFEHFITREHPYRNPALNSWTALELSLFKAGKPGLVIGDGGWLFSSEEFPLPSLREQRIAQNVQRMRDLVDQLARHGVRTVILPIPTKAELYEEHVPARLGRHVLRMDRVNRALEAQGLESIHLDEALQQARQRGEQVFFRTETHWTPEGARVAATVTGAWLRAHGGLTLTPQAFEVRTEAPRPLESDLVNYLPLRPWFASLQPTPETYIPYSFSSHDVADDEGALFSSTSNQLAVVGTSYSADDRWNYPGWLRVGLGTDIDNISDKGKGPFVPMERFLKMVEDDKTGAKLVVWEMPVRVLTMDFSPQRNKGNY